MPEAAGQQNGVIQEKWGEALAAGFQVVSNVLIRAQSRLGLDAVDVVILLNLTAHWWTKDARPFISPASIAKRMNVATRTVERHLKKLEERDFIKRSAPTRTGERIYIRHYDLMPLVGIMREASRTALSERVRRAEQQVQQV